MPDPSEAPGSVVVGGKRLYRRSADQGALAPMFVTASWLLGRLPAVVPEDRRSTLLEALAEARDLTVQVRCSIPQRIRVRDGEQVLVNIPISVAGRRRG